MSQSNIVIRKHLNADALLTTIHTAFENIPDHRLGEVTISLADALMSGCAMVSLHDPSFLVFDTRRKDKATRANLIRIYQIGEMPCDRQMRELLDEVVPEGLLPVYTTMFSQLRRGNVLKKMVFFNGCSLLSVDGTGYVSSKTIHCPSCVEKNDSKTGEVTYSHQMVGAAIVHPQRFRASGRILEW